MDPSIINQSLQEIKAEMNKSMRLLNESIDHRITNAVKNEVANNTQYHVDGKLKAIEKITSQKPLTLEQLSKLYTDIFSALEDLRKNTNGYGLYNQIQEINSQFQQTQAQVLNVSNNVQKLIENKYIDAVTSEQLWDLYSITRSTTDELAKHFKMSIPKVYRILNCSTKDLKTQNEVRIYLENKLGKQKVNNANV